MAAHATNHVHNIMLEAALRYARAGYDVVILHGIDQKTKRCTCMAGAKCPGAGKHPRMKNWTTQATRDADILEKLFTRWPNSNVGVMPAAGTVVVDVDPRNGGDASQLALPARTPTQHTGGGGAHYIVRLADGAVPPKVKGIDYRYPGKHQIVVAPSTHASGGRYEWAKGLGFALRPALWQAPAAPPAASSGPAPELAPLDVPETLEAPVGIVQDWLAHIGADEYGDWINLGQALKHAYGDDGFDVWDAWSQKSDKYPGSDSLRAKWDSFDKNRDRALRTLRSVRHLAQRAGWRYTPPELDFSSDLWRNGLVRDLVCAAPPDIEWIVGNVMPRGKVVMLGGPGGSGKSFLMLVLAIAHSTGSNLLGTDDFSPVPNAGLRKVISFTAEDDREDVHRRLHAVFDAYMLTDELRAEVGEAFSVQCTRGKDWRLVEEVGGVFVASKACELIIDKLRTELGLSLIMFDPSIMFAGVDENDNAAAAAYMRVLDRMASELNVAILVGTHTNKGAINVGEVDQSAVRGASAFVDNARGAWVLRTMTSDEAAVRMVPERERHRYVCLRVVKNNYGPTGADAWLERVEGGALRLATLTSALAPVGTPGTTRVTAKAAALHAHTVEMLRHIDAHSDALVGGVSCSLRGLSRDLWSADATLTSAAMLERTRRALDYAEAQGWLRIARPAEDAKKHATCTYMVTTTGMEQFA